VLGQFSTHAADTNAAVHTGVRELRPDLQNFLRRSQEELRKILRSFENRAAVVQFSSVGAVNKRRHARCV